MAKPDILSRTKKYSRRQGEKQLVGHKKISVG